MEILKLGGLHSQCVLKTAMSCDLGSHEVQESSEDIESSEWAPIALNEWDDGFVIVAGDTAELGFGFTLH